MRYIHAVQGSGIAFIVFSIVSVWASRFPRVSDQAEVVLTVSTFLFAILAGFYISRLNNRYDKMRELVSNEDAHWLSFHELSLFFSKDVSDALTDLIDSYYIVAYDFSLGEYYKYNAVFLHEIYDVLRSVDLSQQKKALEVFDETISHLDQLEEVRNESSVLAQERMGLGQWATLLILCLIMIFSLFQLELAGYMYHIVTILMSTVLVMIILIMRDLQNFRLIGKNVVEESGQEVIESLGKLRYYSNYMVQKGYNTIPKSVTRYRLGMHEPGAKTFILKEIDNRSKKQIVKT